MNGLLDLVLSAVAEPAAAALLHFVWQGAAVAAVLGVLLTLLRRRSADLRYRLSCWALLLMVLLPVGTAVRHAVKDSTESGQAAAVPLEQTLPAAATDDSGGSWNTATAIRTLAQATETTAVTSRIAGTILRQLTWRPPRDLVTHSILGVWIAGILLISLLHLGGWFQVRNLRARGTTAAPDEWQERADRLCRRLGIRQSVRVLCSAAVEVPLVIGWLRPVVLIPASALTGLPLQQYECILAHELAHIWRRDYLVNLLQIVAETLLFYHPAVWWVSRRIRVERENCCDDIAVEMSGDKLSYVRALVDLEELRGRSPRLALSAGDGPLLQRVKRLVGGPEMTTNSNRGLLVGTLAALGIVMCGAVMALAAQHQVGDAVALASTALEGKSAMVGRWSADIQDGRLDFEIRERGGRDDDGHRRGHFNMTLHVETDDFTGLRFGDDVEFELEREAGVFVFTGDFDGNSREAEGDGRFTFTPDTRYVARLADRGAEDLDIEELLVLAAQDLQIETVDELADRGYGPFDGDELVTIAIFDVDSDFVEDMEDLGYKDVGMDELVAMKVHGITREYVKEMLDEGIDASSVHDLLGWKIHDIDPGYMAELREEFGEDMSNDEIMAFKIHNIDAAFAAGLAEAGFADLDRDALMAFKIHNISGRYAEKLRKEFGEDMDAEEIMAFRIHNIDAEYARELKDAGFGDLDREELMACRIHGIDERYAESIRDLGYDLDAEELLAWKIHNINARFIEGLADLGYRNIDADDLIQMKIHGATPRWIQHLRDKGIRDLTVDELIRLRISGVEL